MLEEFHTQDYDIEKCKKLNRLVLKKHKLWHLFTQYYSVFFPIIFLALGFMILISLIIRPSPDYMAAVILGVSSYTFGIFALIVLLRAITRGQSLTRFNGAYSPELNRHCAEHVIKKIGWMKLRDSQDCMVVLTEYAAFWLLIIYDGSDVLLACNSGNTTSRATLPISAKAHNEKLMQFYNVFEDDLKKCI